MKNIESLELPECPYCEEKVWYIEAFLAKNKKTYRCKCCGYTSKVNVKSGAFKLLGVAEIMAIIIFTSAIFIGGSFCLWSIGLIILILMVFYAFSPFMVELFRIKKRFYGVDDATLASMKKESGRDTCKEIYSN